MIGSETVPQPAVTASQPIAIIKQSETSNKVPEVLKTQIPKPERVSVVTPQQKPKPKPLTRIHPTNKPKIQKTDKKPQRQKRRAVYEVTAYALGDGLTPTHGETASGERVKQGRTMACPKSLPFGTELYIPELDHTYTCTDRGGRITSGHLDIYFESIDRANEFGRQSLEVIIRKKPRD